jgi:hypothetical protein
VEWSGVEWSGVEWSGVEWSGVHTAAMSGSCPSKWVQVFMITPLFSCSLANPLMQRLTKNFHSVGERLRLTPPEGKLV